MLAESTEVSEALSGHEEQPNEEQLLEEELQQLLGDDQQEQLLTALQGQFINRLLCLKSLY